MKPPNNPEKYRAALHHNREERVSSPPKPKRAVISTPEKIREIIAEIKKEAPWYADSGTAGESNLWKIFSWLQENDAVGGFSLPKVRVAVAALSYPQDRLERILPPPAQPPPPTPPVNHEEVLESGQLSIHATKQELEKASPAQIRDYLKRLRTQQK
jgi:hypothetical protein